MAKFSTKSCCVVDNGLFVELAITLSKDFGKTYFHSPWESGFPKSNDMLTGKGVKEIERIDDFWGHTDDIDLFVFPDIYMSAWQAHLVEMGKRVWGSRKGDTLELQRDKTKEYVTKHGMNVGKYVSLTGFDALREHLKKHDKQWVKINFTRGDMETFESINYKLSEPKLDELEMTLGAKKHIMKFVVEDDIPDAVEVGYDGFCIDGKYPDHCMWGIEIKDKGYVGSFTEYNSMPYQIVYTNEKLKRFLKKVNYRNFFSTELRITKDEKAYFLDPCMRMGSPPGELYQNMYTNLADIIWNGADGKLVEPIPKGKFGAELLLHSSWADKNWQPIQFPEKLRENIKFRNLTVIKDEYYVVPQSVGLPEIGAVVAIADTLDEAMETCKEYADQVKGYYLDVFPDTLDKAQEEVDKLKEYGMEFPKG